MAKPKNIASDALDLFNNAPTDNQPKQTGKKSKGKEREKIEVENLDRLAAYKIMLKVIESESKLVESIVKRNVIELFAEKMIEAKKRPESFLVQGESSLANAELRKKASNVALDEETVQLLEQKGVPVDKKVLVPKRFVINPEISQEHLKELAVLIKSHPKLKNEKIILQQEEQSVTTVADSTLDALAKVANSEDILLLLEKVATFSVGKFQFEGVSMEVGSGEEKQITPEAKAVAIQILQDEGILPKPEEVTVKRVRKGKGSEATQ